MGGIFFEVGEPPNAEVSIESLKADFPEGQYTVRGVSHDGTGLTGAALHPDHRWTPGQCVRVLDSQYMAFPDGKLQTR